MIDVNLNVMVRFSLTPEGAAAWHQTHPDRYDPDLNRWVPADPPAANTPMECTLWLLMQSVGHDISMGRTPPTVGNTFTILAPIERATLKV